MNDEVEEHLVGWQPVGQRWLEKLPCHSCSGAGILITLTAQACPDCSGNGFIETNKSEIILCPKCLGERKAIIEISANCEDCKGRGYHPRILQRFETTRKCMNCAGSGEVQIPTEEGEGMDCDSCEGSGRSDSVSYCPLPDWKSSPLNSMGGSKVFWSRDDMSEEFQIDSGDFISIVECEHCTDPIESDMPLSELFWIGCGIEMKHRNRCSHEIDENDEIEDEGICKEEHDVAASDGSPINEDCSICKGIHKAIKITESCSDCGGSGWINFGPEDTYPGECPDCEGVGSTVVSENREV